MRPEPRGLAGYLAGEWDGPGGMSLPTSEFDAGAWAATVWPDLVDDGLVRDA